MKVKYLKKFSKDLDRFKKPKEKEQILQVIESVKSSSGLEEISGLKKLSGFKHAYRIRSGTLRIGVFVEDEIVEFARIAHRKDIYKIFP